MSSRLLMSLTALVLAVLGLACTFAPQELLGLAGLPVLPPLALGVQALGAGWLGLATIDWMARGAPFGGIYGRPIALGNFGNFLMLAAALGKAAAGAPSMPLIALAVLAALGALAFARLTFFQDGTARAA
jgi:hypothetical protein